MMAHNIKETDWKLLRRFHAIAMERFCQRVVEAASALTADRSGDYHECFLNLFDLVKERHQTLTRIFDDLRRSTAIILLTNMMAANLLSAEEFSQFSPETRDTVEQIVQIRDRV